ncbi:uncharacterized protein LOC126560007 [Anopheles maculipalpis]|uniref:uncharacterized protein LOC126560007 n=1 Tax=Anopheles maculipalpis TaxID=1496333 RepID=UPI0021591AA4|nr:uncharacterized protein LOC126560007 [Anopheles maculipalpis]
MRFTLPIYSPVTVVLVCVCLFVHSIRAIEVHEDVNENDPIGVHLRVNASIPHTNATGPLVNERNVNDLAAPPAQLHNHHHHHHHQTAPEGEQQQQQLLVVANNFTAFPSNHKQHSGASATVHGQTSSPLTTEVVAIAGITSFSSTTTTAAPPPSAGLSSFRAANGHLYAGRGTSTIVNDRSVQRQISGYRKRQLYASAAPRRNVTGSSDGQFAKEFVPSPEVVPFFNEDNSATGSPAAGAVDASYPTGLSDGDSRWYAGGMGLSGHGYVQAPSAGGGSPEESGKWDHKYTWTTPAVQHYQHHHQQQQQLKQPNVAIKFPQDPTPYFPSPKGKWKWIPEEENESTEGTKSQRPKVGDTPFSSSGSFEEQHFGRHQYVFPTASKNHPYSFDRTPIEGAFSVDPVLVGNNSSNSSGSNSIVSTESTETGSGIGGLTDIKLVGKEDAHLKNVSPWKKIIHVLSAAIPIGLLISALTPQVVYINPNATQPPLQLQTPTPVSSAGVSGPGLRQRSLGQDVPRFLLAQRGLGTDPVALVKLLRKLNALEQHDTAHRTSGPSPSEDDEAMNRLMDTGHLQGCDWKLLCQLARQGMSGTGTAKMLWKIVSETPPEWTDRLGLEEIFRIIRDGDCDRLQRTCDQDT